jgi:hypothetical protein
MVSLLLAALVAPAWAAVPEALDEGTMVRVKAVGKDDAYFPNREQLVGMVCRVQAGGVHVNRKDLYGGPLVCNNGEDYYFYTVRLEVLPAATAVSDVLAAREQAIVAESAPPTPAAQNTSSASTLWPAGKVGVVTAISADDAYHGQLAELKGQRCTVGPDGLTETGTGWWSGAMTCAGTERYFFQVALEPAVQGASVASGATWGAGALVKVLAIDASDALHSQRASVEGHTCSVVETAMVPSGEDTWAGRLFCDDGKQWQVFRARVAKP